MISLFLTNYGTDYGQTMVQTFVRQMNKTFVRLSQGKRKTMVRL